MKYFPTVKYAWLQGSFWMSFCIVFNFAGMYLLSKGYSNSQIGMIIAVAGLISALLQPAVAGLADTHPRITLRRLILILSLLMMLCPAILLIPGLYFLLYALFYGIVIAVLQILTPLVNAIGMECINRGISVNFGFARGVGSVSFALMSFAAGHILERFSTTAVVIPVLIIFCYLSVFAAAWFFCFTSGTSRQAEQTLRQDKDSSDTSFFSAYKKFFVLLTGISFLFICHNMLNNYLFQIMSFHQGGSREMGTASAIAAVVELPTMLAFSFLIRKISSGTLLKISGVFFTLKSLLTFSAMGISAIYLAQVTQMLGFALFVPASVYYTNSLIRESDRAKGQAFMTATNTIGSVFGSLLGGFLIDGAGIGSMLLTATGICAVGALLVFYSAEKC